MSATQLHYKQLFTTLQYFLSEFILSVTNQQENINIFFCVTGSMAVLIRKRIFMCCCSKTIDSVKQPLKKCKSFTSIITVSMYRYKKKTYREFNRDAANAILNTWNKTASTIFTAWNQSIGFCLQLYQYDSHATPLLLGPLLVLCMLRKQLKIIFPA